MITTAKELANECKAWLMANFKNPDADLVRGVISRRGAAAGATKSQMADVRAILADWYPCLKD